MIVHDLDPRCGVCDSSLHSVRVDRSGIVSGLCPNHGPVIIGEPDDDPPAWTPGDPDPASPVTADDIAPPECPHGRQVDYEHCAECAS